MMKQAMNFSHERHNAHRNYASYLANVHILGLVYHGGSPN